MFFFWLAIALQILMIVGCIITIDRELISERIRPKGKDKDPLAPLILSVLYLAQFILPYQDMKHWHIADNMPEILKIIALLPLCIGWAGMVWSMKTNKFFSSAIRLQADRGQTVVQQGPYKWMRHPGYAFASIAFFFQSFILGSWLAFIPAILCIIDLVYRTNLEEKMLTDGLAGYKEYKAQTPWRWYPHIW